MKKVLIAIGSLYGGGAERVVSVWANGLIKKGYDVSILLYSRKKGEYFVDERVKIYTIASSEIECNNMSFLRRVKAFRNSIKKINPDVIISFLPEMQIYIRFASFGLGIPRIETVRNNPLREGPKNRKYRFLWMNCFKSSSAIITQCNEQMKLLPSKYHKKCVVIPNPVNERYLFSEVKNYNDSHKKLIAVGRLDIQKNYFMMIDSIKIVKEEFPDVHLDVYGEGPLKDEIMKYIDKLELNSNINLLGRSNNLYEVFAKKNIYLLTSDFEGMPNALIEAMAMGLICISTDCPTGPKDLIINNDNGYLVSVNDSLELAEKIKFVIKMMSDSKEKMGRKAKNTISNYCSEENSLLVLTSLLDKVIGEKKL